MKQGSNLFTYYHEDSNKKALERVAIENKLSRALEESELYLVFQPIIELKSNRVIELDLNLRWRAEDERIIYPSQFLPLVSELGMIRDFSDWLISSSFATLQRWNEEGLSVCININLRIEYLATNYAMDLIKTKLSTHRINPKFVFISILEDDPQFSINKLEPYFKEIYGLGINMVLDDFGKIRASLNDLSSTKFHSVKFSKRLTRNIGKSKVDDNILVSMIRMMDNLNVATIAKGIENAEQLEFLTGQGCKYAQGFLISDPLNESQARQALLSR
jgi:EAL domain-containing protein (putative c-di-GMP-specific phosphodiesterase class I)